MYFWFIPSETENVNSLLKFVHDIQIINIYWFHHRGKHCHTLHLPSFYWLYSFATTSLARKTPLVVATCQEYLLQVKKDKMLIIWIYDKPIFSISSYLDSWLPDDEICGCCPRGLVVSPSPSIRFPSSFCLLRKSATLMPLACKYLIKRIWIYRYTIMVMNNVESYVDVWYLISILKSHVTYTYVAV